MALVYALVARAADGAVLTHYAPGSSGSGGGGGNEAELETVAIECYRSFDHAAEDRFTILCDGYTFNFLVSAGFVFGVVAGEAFGREVPFACAARLKAAWGDKLRERGRRARPHGMERAFRPVLRRELEHCMGQAFAEEATRAAALRAKVDEVKGILIANLEHVFQPPDKPEASDYSYHYRAAQSLEEKADLFKQKGREVEARVRCCCGPLKALVVLLALLVAAAVVGVSICLATGPACAPARAKFSALAGAAAPALHAPG